MSLSSLLEDKRYEWQKTTQEEILNSLLCKSHKYKSLGQRNEKLVMVFGKSHAGKTTFILSLMGVAENKLSDLNFVLRAGIPEGRSSTATAIVYQKSDDDRYGVCERGINDVEDYNIEKCSKEEFIKKIQETRLAVESRKRDKDIVLYLYIPQSYFDDKECVEYHINILDVPGYETTNLEERYHTEAILSRYMSVSALNIVVRSIYDINDLQYFMAPNRDDFTKLTSGKYIIVTTRTYSQESIFKYFLQPQKNRTTSFEEMLNNVCKEQFARIFGEKIPTFFPIDIGESFYELINTKINNQADRDYLIAYRKRIFESIYQCILSKQSDSLISWINEVLEDEEYYGNFETAVIDEKIKNVNKDLDDKKRQLQKRKGDIIRLEDIYQEATGKVEELIRKYKELQIPEFGDEIDNLVDACRREYFTEDYKRKKVDNVNDLPEQFAEISTDLLKNKVEELISEHSYVISEKMSNCWLIDVNDAEIEIRESLNEAMNAHKIIKVLNPSNKEKITLGRNKLCSIIPNLIKKFYEQVRLEYETQISHMRNKEIKELTILLNENKIKNKELEKIIEVQLFEKAKLEEQKKAIGLRVEKDKKIILEYLKIAKNNYNCRRMKVLTLMNDASTKVEKMEYLILLGLMEKDYKRIAKE